MGSAKCRKKLRQATKKLEKLGDKVASASAKLDEELAAAKQLWKDEKAALRDERDASLKAWKVEQKDRVEKWQNSIKTGDVRDSNSVRVGLCYEACKTRGVELEIRIRKIEALNAEIAEKFAMQKYKKAFEAYFDDRFNMTSSEKDLYYELKGLQEYRNSLVKPLGYHERIQETMCDKDYSASL
mmetsp:Transcript_15968/g.29193  ORF Transcript_15968/g.29193 Transcript_15968/m.29193 type:complete len:184 (+) Transcript_15968:362-913(+)